VRAEGDSVGGVIQCRVHGVPPGLGEPVFDRLEADLAKAMLSLPATKGFEVGSGFAGTYLRGSEHNDAYVPKAGRTGTATNRSGGIQGGISDGEEIFFSVAFKPTATIMKPQLTVDLEGRPAELAGSGRHDPCVLPRAVPIVEAMAALVLVAAGSGRREVLADLIEEGLGEGDRPAVLVSEGEPADAADARLPGVLRWRLLPGAGIEAEFPRDATHVFIVTDGRSSPVDQIEALKAWLAERASEVARVICVVDCRLAAGNPKLFAWFEACVHFSDVVLLNRREGVPSKWVGDFRKEFE